MARIPHQTLLIVQTVRFMSEKSTLRALPIWIKTVLSYQSLIWTDSYPTGSTYVIFILRGTCNSIINVLVVHDTYMILKRSCVLLASHDSEPEQNQRFKHGRSRRPENLPNVPHDDHVGTNRSCFRISSIGPDGQTDRSCVFAAYGNSTDQSGFGRHVAGKFRKRR